MTDRRRSSRQLAEFLRARRADLAPEAVGLPRVGHPRRVTGLRREEVAQLANMSTDYYTRLEQGRLPPPSETVLSALARALRLGPDEERYLRSIAGRSVAPVKEPEAPIRKAAWPLHALVASMAGVPAVVVSRHLDVLAWNPAAVALFVDFEAIPEAERNAARLVFLDERMRSRFVEWESAARTAAALLRMGAARDPDDDRLAVVVNELSEHSALFRSCWAAQDVVGRSHGNRRYVHPVEGELELEWQSLTSSTHPDQFVIALTPPEPRENACDDVDH